MSPLKSFLKENFVTFGFPQCLLASGYARLLLNYIPDMIFLFLKFNSISDFSENLPEDIREEAIMKNLLLCVKVTYLLFLFFIYFLLWCFCLRI